MISLLGVGGGEQPPMGTLFYKNMLKQKNWAGFGDGGRKGSAAGSANVTYVAKAVAIRGDT